MKTNNSIKPDKTIIKPIFDQVRTTPWNFFITYACSNDICKFVIR